MNTKVLATLAAAGIGVALVATLVGGGGSSSAPAGGGASAALFPTFNTDVAGLTSLRIVRGDVTTTIAKAESGAWSIAERDGYPADPEKVRSLLVSLADARIAERKTSDPANYPRLGVEDPAPGNSAALVELRSGEKPFAALIVGRAPGEAVDFSDPGARARPGVFVRRAGEAATALLEKAIDIPAGPAGWMNQEILRLDRERTREAAFARPEREGAPAESFRILRDSPAGETFRLEPMPEGRTLRSPGALDPIATLLAFVTADDVARASSLDGIAPETTATFSTFDGLTLTATISRKDGVGYATFAASHTPVPAAAPPADATDAQKREAQAKADADNQRVAKEAQDLNARLSGWAFKLPDFKLQQFATTLGSLLAEPAAAGETQPSAETAPPETPLIFPGVK